LKPVLPPVSAQNNLNSQQQQQQSGLGLSLPLQMQQTSLPTATLQQYYQASQFGGMSAIPSPPAVLFNSAMPSQSGLYNPLQFSQYSGPYGTAGSGAYSAYMPTAPQQTAPADMYQNLTSQFRMSGAVQSPFNQPYSGQYMGMYPPPQAPPMQSNSYYSNAAVGSAATAFFGGPAAGLQAAAGMYGGYGGASPSQQPPHANLVGSQYQQLLAATAISQQYPGYPSATAAAPQTAYMKSNFFCTNYNQNLG
jgi:hypothetical protein